MSRGHTILSMTFIIGLFVVAGCTTMESQGTQVSTVQQQLQEQAQEIATLEQTLAQRDRELQLQEQRAREAQRMAETAREQTQAAEARARATATPSTANGQEMLPPQAKPGECYARVFVPPT
jgi:hypothetical protein